MKRLQLLGDILGWLLLALMVAGALLVHPAPAPRPAPASPVCQALQTGP